MEFVNKDCLFLIFDNIHVIKLLQLKSVSHKFNRLISDYIKIRNLGPLINSFSFIFTEQNNLMVSLVDIAMMFNLPNVLEYSMKYPPLKPKEYHTLKVSVMNNVFCAYGINHAIRCRSNNSIKWFISNFHRIEKNYKLATRGEMFTLRNLTDIFNGNELSEVKSFFI